MQMNNATISIIDMTGRTVYSQAATSTRINQTLQSGNYIVILSDGKNTYRNRLVSAE
jgi:uncharacterized protein with von Willebrand factor type A (vWA) domain